MGTVTVLERINDPRDLRALHKDELLQLCREIREYTVEMVQRTGGHISSSLGTVELTVALHRVFESPRDKIVWDTGHQAYVHKMLTGRRARFDTLRQLGGISGFLVRTESEHDQFGAGHAGTSIAAAHGMALEVLDHDRLGRAAVEGDLDDGVGMRQGVAQDACVDLEGDRLALPAIDDPGDAPCAAQTAHRAGPVLVPWSDVELRGFSTSHCGRPL